MEIAISAQAKQRPVPPSFLGISTETWTLPDWHRRDAVLARVLSTLHVPGDQQLTLRVGGDSTDQTILDRGTTPEWSYELTPAWMGELRELVLRARLRVILDLNLITASPDVAAWVARSAAARLPPGSIAGFEVGNEPDLYSRFVWRRRLREHRATIFLPTRITAASYAASFDAYAEALADVLPALRGRPPVLGPALAHPDQNASWLTALLRASHRGLGALTVHRYPYSACSPPTSRTFPTIDRVLSEHATHGLAHSVARALAISSRAGYPLRLTEINSVTCGGRRGVSDAFATALWAPDALFELVHAGVRAAAVHVRSKAVNQAFGLSGRGLRARPLLYGMIMFTRTLGPGPRLVELQLHAGVSLHFKAWAVSDRHGRLRILLINKGPRSLRVQLRLPTRGPATVQRLTAPSVRSRSDVTLNGQHLDASGRWRGRQRTAAITLTSRGYEAVVPADSAALVTTRLRNGALARSHGS